MIDITIAIADAARSEPLLADVARSLWRYRDHVAALLFVGFFAAAAVVLARGADERLRTAFVGCLLLGLAVPGITGLEPYPFVDMREFTTPASQSETAYEIRVVDEDGAELSYDPRAAPPMIDATLRTQGERMVEEYRASTCRAVAAHLLEEAREYRSTVEDRPPLSAELFDFPHHKIAFRWTPDDLDDRAAFVGVRVYRISMTTSEDGRTVESRTETRVVDVRLALDAGSASENATGTPTATDAGTAGGCSTPSESGGPNAGVAA